jgi:hypothetical protein
MEQKLAALRVVVQTVLRTVVLYSQVFYKYFHPDLRPCCHMLINSIWQVRRFLLLLAQNSRTA